MESLGSSVKALSRIQRELSSRAEQPLYRHMDSPLGELATTGYISSLDYWHSLVRYGMTVLLFALAGLISAILISVVQTPLFRARTSLEIQDFNENFLDLNSVDPNTGNYTTAESYFETQVKILQSESLLGRVIDKLKLQEGPTANSWHWPSWLWRRRFGWSGSSPLPTKEDLIDQAQRNLTVRADGRTRLLEVLYESSDPKAAADFANALVSEFIEQSREMRWKSTQHTGEWLTRHLHEMKTKLEQSEAQLQDYARISGLTLISEKDNIAEIRLKQLQVELSNAEADRIAKQAKFE